MRHLWWLGILAFGCEQTVDDTDDTNDTDTDTDTAGYTLAVDADGSSEDVDLATLTTTDVGGDQVVPLTAVLGATSYSVTWTERTYDFEASDGYRPSSKDCGPVDYTTLESGYLYPATGNLLWDDALALPGCFFVDGVVLLDVMDAATR